MLKIKDNVDLKELEKYGIEKETKELYSDSKNDTGLFFYKNDKYHFKSKNIYMNSHDFDEDCLDLLYDLIKDGLVEKVED